MKVIVGNETNSILPTKFIDSVNEKTQHVRKGSHAGYSFRDGDDLLILVKSSRPVDEIWVVSAGRRKKRLK